MGHYTSADSRQNTQLPWHCSVIFVQHLYSLHPLAIQSTDEFTSVRACEHCLCMLVFMSRKELMSACLSLNPHDCFIFPFLLRQVFQVLSAITALCLQLQGLCSSHACISLYSGVKGFQHKQVCYRFLFSFFFKSPVHIQSVANVILSSGMCEDHTNCCSDPYSATDGRPFSYDSSQHFKCFKLLLGTFSISGN